MTQVVSEKGFIYLTVAHQIFVKNSLHHFYFGIFCFCFIYNKSSKNHLILITFTAKYKSMPSLTSRNISNAMRSRPLRVLT